MKFSRKDIEGAFSSKTARVMFTFLRRHGVGEDTMLREERYNHILGKKSLVIFPGVRFEMEKAEEKIDSLIKESEKRYGSYDKKMSNDYKNMKEKLKTLKSEIAKKRKDQENAK